jgi:hypothetical protein
VTKPAPIALKMTVFAVFERNLLSFWEWIGSFPSFWGREWEWVGLESEVQPSERKVRRGKGKKGEARRARFDGRAGRKNI